jgi:putative SOS response-associated peptidase YedK
VPSNGFYEWRRTGSFKQPCCFEVEEGALFACGNMGSLEGPKRQYTRTFSILTTTPNALTTAIHDRMPVILDPDNYDLWFDPEIRNVTATPDLQHSRNSRIRLFSVVTLQQFSSQHHSRILRPELLIRAREEAVDLRPVHGLRL